MLSLGLVSLSQSPELLARVEAAVASQRAAVDLEPQSAAAYRALAEAYAQHKFMRAASTHLATAVALEPANAEAYRLLGTVLRRTGDEAGTRRAYDARSKCKKRRELISYFNLAPDAIDRFLLPFGVNKVAVLDADASPDERFPAFYDVPNARPLAALSRPLKKCRRVWEGYRLDHPLVRATLGASLDEVNQRRFRADAFLVSDVQAYCRHRVAERVVDVPRGGRRGRGWRVRARRQRRQDDHDGEDGEEDDSHRLLRRLGGARGHHPSPCRCRSCV